MVVLGVLVAVYGAVWGFGGVCVGKLCGILENAGKSERGKKVMNFYTVREKS